MLRREHLAAERQAEELQRQLLLAGSPDGRSLDGRSVFVCAGSAGGASAAGSSPAGGSAASSPAAALPVGGGSAASSPARLRPSPPFRLEAYQRRRERPESGRHASAEALAAACPALCEVREEQLTAELLRCRAGEREAGAAAEAAEASVARRLSEADAEHAARLQQAVAQQCMTLRAELGAECTAVRRAFHQAEERQWRHQALLDHARQQAVRTDAELRELRSALRAKDEDCERRLAQERHRTACEEAAALSRAEARLRAELGAEREALYARIREQLVGLAARPGAAAGPPFLSVRQQVV